MADRKDLHEALKAALGNNNVYFQPPESKKLDYPCIVYHLNNYDVKFAEDKKYLSTKRYQMTFITTDPVSKTVDKLHMLDFCRFERWYAANNLNHYVYSIYY